MCTVMLWIEGSVPVTMRRKSSQVDVVQSAPRIRGAPVKGPPLHEADAVVGDIVPLEGVAACATVVSRKTKRAKISKNTEVRNLGGVDIGDLPAQRSRCLPRGENYVDGNRPSIRRILKACRGKP